MSMVQLYSGPCKESTRNANNNNYYNNSVSAIKGSSHRAMKGEADQGAMNSTARYSIYKAHTVTFSKDYCYI